MMIVILRRHLLLQTIFMIVSAFLHSTSTRSNINSTKLFITYSSTVVSALRSSSSLSLSSSSSHLIRQSSSSSSSSSSSISTHYHCTTATAFSLALASCRSKSRLSFSSNHNNNLWLNNIMSSSSSSSLSSSSPPILPVDNKMMGRNGENNKKKRSFTSLSSSASAASSSSTSTAKENDDKVTPSSEPAAPAVSTPSESHQSAAEQGEPQEQPVQPVQPKEQLEIPEIPLLYLEEGLFAVNKPLGWTSQDVVGKIRNILEQDAKSRNVPDPRKKKRKPWMKVGHGGTLDPLATGVLVIGVGKGTKSLQKYLVGPKGYKAEITLGYQTSTLDTEITGSIVQRKSYDHVTSYNQINNVLQTKFVGKIQQVPPIFSALKRDGKKLYQLAREDGLTADDIQIDSREVIIYKLELDDDDCSRLLLKEEESQENNDSDTNINTKPIKKFSINVECGGGTYIRSLVRDIGIELGTCATMTKLERTKQGYFNKQEHCIQYQINDKNNDGNIDDYSPSNNNNNNNNAGHDDDDTTTPTEIKTSNEKDNNEEQKGENANANANAKANSNATTNTNTNTNTNRIDKRKECNWTVETITDAIISSRERLLLLDDNDNNNDNNNDGLDNDNDNSRL